MPPKRVRKKKTKEVEEAEDIKEVTEEMDETESMDGDETESMDGDDLETHTTVPVPVADWKAEVESTGTEPLHQAPSVVEFDHDEVAPFEDSTVSALNSMDLLKVLVVRGARQWNPALQLGAKKVMRQLNGETRTFKPFVPVPGGPPSIADFDRDEARTFDDRTVSELDVMDLLKVLVVRGADQHNPTLGGESERLMRQLNCESLGNRGGRGGRGGRGRRGRGRGRGGRTAPTDA